MSNQESIIINATVRDFQADHPDFEKDFFTEGLTGLSEPETGIVEAKLGDDKKPVYDEQHQHKSDCLL